MKHQIHFDGRQIELSNPDKVLWLQMNTPPDAQIIEDA